MSMNIMGNMQTPKERKHPPEYTTADESYQNREEESNGLHQDPPSSPVRRSNGSSGASRAISCKGTRPLGG